VTDNLSPEDRTTSDLMADVMWWLAGYVAAEPAWVHPDAAIADDHFDALRKVRAHFEDTRAAAARRIPADPHPGGGFPWIDASMCTLETRLKLPDGSITTLENVQRWVDKEGDEPVASNLARRIPERAEVDALERHLRRAADSFDAWAKKLEETDHVALSRRAAAEGLRGCAKHYREMADEAGRGR